MEKDIMQNEETQKPMGIIVDWISHLKNTLGLSETNFNYIFFSHQEELENALLENTVDLIFPVSAKTSNGDLRWRIFQPGRQGRR